MSRRSIRSQTEKVLPPVRSNIGIETNYEKALEKHIEAMERSITYWLKVVYRANTPEVQKLAKDASPAETLRRAYNRMASKWNRHFDKLAPQMAEFFMKKTTGRADKAMAKILHDAGWTVEFQATRAANDVYRSLVGENVGLIRNLASETLTKIQGHVLRSVQVGGDMGSLAKALEDQFGLTKRRSSLIARDQVNKATAVYTRQRQIEIGCTHAIWRHSRAGRVPRPEHVGWDGSRYEITKGKWSVVDNCFVYPGSPINCRCSSLPIIPGLE